MRKFEKQARVVYNDNNHTLGTVVVQNPNNGRVLVEWDQGGEHWYDSEDILNIAGGDGPEGLRAMFAM